MQASVLKVGGDREEEGGGAGNKSVPNGDIRPFRSGVIQIMNELVDYL